MDIKLMSFVYFCNSPDEYLEATHLICQLLMNVVTIFDVVGWWCLGVI